MKVRTKKIRSLQDPIHPKLWHLLISPKREHRENGGEYINQKDNFSKISYNERFEFPYWKDPVGVQHNEPKQNTKLSPKST